MSSAVPQVIAALYFHGAHGLIYVDPKSNLVSWLYYTGTELDKIQYELQNAIQVNQKVTIKAHHDKIAVVHYTTKENNEDIYQKVSDLKDKKKSAWYRGSNGKPTFDAKNIVADANSPLSATYDGKILRVYYKKANEEKLYVAYTKDKPAPSAQEVWEERVAAEKF